MKRLVYTAVFVAFGTVLPALFHAVGMGGPVFLPMHLPVLLAGLTLGPAAGLATGVLSPGISFLLTGMPPVSPPVLPLMVVELATYGAVAGAMMRLRRGVLCPLVTAMVAGRIALGLAAAVAHVLFAFKASPVAYVTGAVIAGLPGMAIQVVLVPLLVRWRGGRA